jgi:hypothetical protein
LLSGLFKCFVLLFLTGCSFGILQFSSATC